MECLDYATYVENRMNKMGLPLPGSFFDSYESLMNRLGQLSAMATLSPTASVASVASGVTSAAGAVTLFGVLSAGGTVFYVSALAGTLFFAAAEGQHCRNTNSLSSSQLISWMKSKGIYDVEGIEAEFIRSPQLRVA